jgi:hypothetical protein
LAGRSAEGGTIVDFTEPNPNCVDMNRDLGLGFDTNPFSRDIGEIKELIV